MVAGQGSREQAEARRLAYRDPGQVRRDHRRDRGGHVRLSVAARSRPAPKPCNCSTAGPGSLSPAEFERWVIAPTARIVDAARGRASATCRSSVFPRAPAASSRAYARETGVDAIGLDETVDPAWAARELPAGLPVQGNLDPLALIAGGEALDERRSRILDAFAGRPHIFNLGHGIQQDTPIAHVEQLMALVKGADERIAISAVSSAPPICG